MVLNNVKESCNFEKLLHAKWSNFARSNTQKNHQIFRDVGGRLKNDTRKFFKERSSKLEKGYSQDLVKQTVGTKTLGWIFFLLFFANVIP